MTAVRCASRSLAVIVADARDDTARAVAARLAGTVGTLQPVLVSPVDLAQGAWQQRIAPDGKARTAFRSHTAAWDDEDIGVVWYRAISMWAPQFARSGESDRAYALTELNALVASWLHGLGERAVNQPSGASATGPVWPSSRWVDEARRAGLRVAPRTSATSARMVHGFSGSSYEAKLPWQTPEMAEASILVVDTGVVGDVADIDGCSAVRLAERAACRFLRLNLANIGGRLAFVSAEPAGACVKAQEIDATAALLASVASRRAAEVAV